MHRAAIVAALALACGRPGDTSEHAPETMPAKTGPEEHKGPHAGEHHHGGDHPEPRADHRGHEHHKHHRFDDAAKWSQQFDSPDRAEWQKPDQVVAALGLTPAMRVADLGAGTGYFTVRLARAVPEGQVVANDREPDMVRWIGERAAKEGLGNVVAIEGVPDDPRLPGDLDLALMVDTYHHIGEPTRFFGKVRDALKPGGRLVIVDFKKDAPDDAPGPPAAIRVDHGIVTAHLAKLGFAHERTELELLPYQYIVFMRKPG